MADKGSKGLSVTKQGNFSEWYSEIVQKAELADLRYNVKGFLVFQPWSVLSMENIYYFLEKKLREKGHNPYFFPTLIPESNLKKETHHIKGFTPEVFWVTHGGETKFEERLALRPTSETAFYQMFALWLRSYKELPFKTYQRANVFRYETKATRPFLRSREFHWIETHCVHASKEDAEKQVKEDMQTTKEVLHDVLGLPFIFFERPAWDKFPGADRTFAADVLNPDGKVVQQPSTHLLSQDFSKGFDVKFKDAKGDDKYGWITCYGPAVSRIFASVVITHGDDKGLRLPLSISPYQIVICPVGNETKLMKKAEEIKESLEGYRVFIDNSERSPGEKFNYWEMKGVPMRIDLGERELKEKKYNVFRRDLGMKVQTTEKEIGKTVAKIAKEFDLNLINQADGIFKGRIKDAKSLDDVKKIVDDGCIARASFCAVDEAGKKCGLRVEDVTGARVRGTNLEREKAAGKCVVCGKKAGEVVYIARDY